MGHTNRLGLHINLLQFIPGQPPMIIPIPGIDEEDMITVSLFIAKGAGTTVEYINDEKRDWTIAHGLWTPFGYWIFNFGSVRARVKKGDTIRLKSYPQKGFGFSYYCITEKGNNDPNKCISKHQESTYEFVAGDEDVYILTKFFEIN